MPNTLTSLIQPFHAALNVVSRELAGAIPSVTRDARTDRAAVNQAVISMMAPASSATDITPGVTPPNDGDQVIDNEQVTITKSRRVPFRWNGEEELGLRNSGADVGSLQGDQLQEAIRTLVNEMETDLVLAARLGSRAFGTVGTTPFTTDLDEAAQVRKILDDNGAPGARSLIINTNAGVRLRRLAQLTKANEAGTDMTLRDGELLDIFGLSLKESAGVASVTAGNGAAYTSTAAGFAIGVTSIPIITGAGTVLAGDNVTFAGDTNKYTVRTGVAAPGTIVLAAPGLRQAIPLAATAMTIVGTGVRNVAFSRSAIVLATRLPALPKDGDSAVDRMTVTDPRSGISFEIAMYAQYRQMQYEVSAAWGAQVVKRNHVATLLG